MVNTENVNFEQNGFMIPNTIRNENNTEISLDIIIKISYTAFFHKACFRNHYPLVQIKASLPFCKVENAS